MRAKLLCFLHVDVKLGDVACRSVLTGASLFWGKNAGQTFNFLAGMCDSVKYEAVI